MRRWLAAGVALLALAGCGLIPDPPSSDVETDTSGLAKAKKAAGIEDCTATSAQDAPDGGMPDITLECLGGGPSVALTGLTGKPAVINLWASYCKPCREELPVLARLHDEASDKVTVLGVDYQDADPDAALALAARSGVTYPQLVDRKASLRDPLKVIGLPQTVFLDAQGRIVGTERGGFTTYESLLAAVEKYTGLTW